MLRITKTFADKVTKPGFYRADDTLYLQVVGPGGKSWIQRITVEGRRRNLGLGPYPVVTIEEAKAKALDNRRNLYRGESPITETRAVKDAEKEASTMPAFKAMALEYHATQSWGENTLRYSYRYLKNTYSLSLAINP